MESENQNTKLKLEFDGAFLEILVNKEDERKILTEFAWTDDTIQLLLENYNERKIKFMDPNIKKKNLWQEIKNVFMEKGYFVTLVTLDKKFRSLKQTFSRIKNLQKIKKNSGVGSTRWKFYNKMSEILSVNTNTSVFPEDFAWTDDTILLLLENYNKRKRKFMDPNIKKKKIWQEIQNVFVENGYLVTLFTLDKKFRNLKQSFLRIKNLQNNKKNSGIGCTKWKFYNIMSKIFCADKCVLPEDFAWTDDTILLLLENYDERKTEFMNPNIMKKNLWQEIQNVFVQKGHFVTLDTLDKKFRNLKKTFLRINDLQKNSGGGTTKWRFYNKLAKIFCVDKIELPEDFTWTDGTILLLLENYNERKTKFMDPNSIKKHLWQEIQKVFVEMGYFVTYDILDKKFRNLKHTFLRIKDLQNIKKNSGVRSTNWRYYDKMSAIFYEDTNIFPVVEPTDSIPNFLAIPPEIIPLSTNSPTPSSTDEQFITTTSTLLPSCTTSTSTSTEQLLLPISTHHSPNTSTSRSENHLRSINRRRNLARQRTEQLQIEKERNESIKNIADVLKQLLETQKENNEILKALIKK